MQTTVNTTYTKGDFFNNIGCLNLLLPEIPKATYMSLYIINRKTQFAELKVHCRVCHHTSKALGNQAPKRCSNKSCQSYSWDIFPSDFDLTTTQCPHCKILWQLEQQLSPEQKVAPKRRGRKPSKK
jgi:hypothetical protein